MVTADFSLCAQLFSGPELALSFLFARRGGQLVVGRQFSGAGRRASNLGDFEPQGHEDNASDRQSQCPENRDLKHHKSN